MRWRTLLALQRGIVAPEPGSRSTSLAAPPGPAVLPWAAVRDARFAATARFSPAGRPARAMGPQPLPEREVQVAADPAR
jgi:hypothetical protein